MTGAWCVHGNNDAGMAAVRDTGMAAARHKGGGARFHHLGGVSVPKFHGLNLLTLTPPPFA